MLFTIFYKCKKNISDFCKCCVFFSYFLSPLASQRRSPLKGPSNRIEKLLELMEDKNIKIL